MRFALTRKALVAVFLVSSLAQLSWGGPIIGETDIAGDDGFPFGDSDIQARSGFEVVETYAGEDAENDIDDLNTTCVKGASSHGGSRPRPRPRPSTKKEPPPVSTPGPVSTLGKSKTSKTFIASPTSEHSKASKASRTSKASQTSKASRPSKTTQALSASNVSKTPTASNSNRASKTFATSRTSRSTRLSHIHTRASSTVAPKTSGTSSPTTSKAPSETLVCRAPECGSDSNPGAGPGLGNDPKPMPSYENAGISQLSNYQTAITKKVPDTKIVESEEDVAKEPVNRAFLDIHKIDELQLDTSLMRIDQEAEFSVLKTKFDQSMLGFNMRSENNNHQITITPNKQPGVVIMRTTYNKGGKFIIFQDAFKEKNVGTGAKKLQLNEMVMQNFLTVAGEKSNKLEVVFFMNIQNKEFWAITKQNYHDKGKPLSEMLRFQRGSPQFNRFMGSPNVHSKFFGFANHHGAIGNKIPKEFIVIPRQVEGSGGKLTVALTFEASA